MRSNLAKSTQPQRRMPRFSSAERWPCPPVLGSQWISCALPCRPATTAWPEGGAQIGNVASLEAGAQLFSGSMWGSMQGGCLQRAQRPMHDRPAILLACALGQPLPVSTSATVVMSATAASPTSEMPDSLSRECTALKMIWAGGAPACHVRGLRLAGREGSCSACIDKQQGRISGCHSRHPPHNQEACQHTHPTPLVWPARPAAQSRASGAATRHRFQPDRGGLPLSAAPEAGRRPKNDCNRGLQEGRHELT